MPFSHSLAERAHGNNECCTLLERSTGPASPGRQTNYAKYGRWSYVIMVK